MTARPRRPYTRVYAAAYTLYASDPRVKREAEALAEAGYQVAVLTLRDPRHPPRRVEHGVEIRCTDQPRYMGGGTLRYLAAYLQFVLATARWLSAAALRGERFIVHLHTLPDFIVFAALLPRLLGMPVVLDIHDLMAENYCTKFGLARNHPLARLLRRQTRLAARFATVVLTVHEPLRRTLRGYGIPARKIRVVLNTPDERLFHPADPPARNGGHPFTLISHGTVAPRLGFDLIVRAGALLRDDLPDLAIHLLGTGDAEPEVRRLIHDLGLERVVDFPAGFVPVEEVAAHIAAADLGVVATRPDETTHLMLPLKLTEYLAMGIPAVCSRLRTVDEYTGGRGVLYFDGDDAASLAAAVRRLYHDRTLLAQLAGETAAFRHAHGWRAQKAGLRRTFARIGGIPS